MPAKKKSPIPPEKIALYDKLSLPFLTSNAKAVAFPKKEVGVLIHTRLQPGDRECREKGETV